ncbi:MAG TPA: phosphatidate cytidylyltransferase [Streptosporangiaceae bacterium]|nr:phosphatidate cytidylyltransferase [Streptosporangiaceae bacterium]
MAAQAQEEKPKIRTGRNLPAAIGVGAVMGGLVLLTLLTVKATFLLYMGGAVLIALDELAKALKNKHIDIPIVPLGLGTVAMLTCTYWLGYRGMAAAAALTVLAILGYRLVNGTENYVRDATAGVFVSIYIAFLASFVSAMLAAPHDGNKRVITFVIVVVCSDIGGYFAGITLGRGTRHPMAPKISPKKTWEGFAGSMTACLVAGWLTVTLLLHGHAWQGVLLGAAVVVTAIAGDLIESSIKRDLDIKDMGTLLPGHGGLLDRLDSLLMSAPVVWLLLVSFIPHG